MGVGNELYRAIEAVHRASLDSGGWVAALGVIGAMTGSRAVTVDSFDLKSLLHRSLKTWNMQPATRIEYLGFTGSMNKRVRYAVSRPDKKIVRDGDVFADEGEIDREPFYAEFLALHDTRYFAAGRWRASPRATPS